MSQKGTTDLATGSLALMVPATFRGILFWEVGEAEGENRRGRREDAVRHTFQRVHDPDRAYSTKDSGCAFDCA